MKFRLSHLVYVGAFIFFNMQTSFATLPSDYESLTKEEKLGLLWNQIDGSQWNELPALNNQGWSSLLKNIGALFSLNKSFDHTSDEIPEGRPKFIHTYGSVVQVSFVPTESTQFSGMYAKGAMGLARLSLAASPEAIPYTPGMAIKFLVDGKPSVNLHVMNSLNGQDDNWNFFEKTFSNKIDPAEGFVLKILEKVFERARKPANDLPVDHLARIYQDGSQVDSVVAPERLLFKPTANVRSMIDPSSRADFREHLNSIPAGTKLYGVYGVLRGKQTKIGHIVTESEMVSSQYADKTLFFQHKR